MISQETANRPIQAVRRFGLAIGIASAWSLTALAGGQGIDSAHDKGWKSAGPAPPTIAAPIAAHAASGTIYINSLSGGIFKSTNRGATFEAVPGVPLGYSSLAV